jgi:subtilisin family serine protease
MPRQTKSLYVLIITFTLSITVFGGSPPRKIVVFDDNFTNSAAQTALLKNFETIIEKPLKLVNGMSVYLPPQAQKALSKRPEVLRIDDDIRVMATGKPANKPGGGKKDPPAQADEVTPWGITHINADLAWTITSGANIKVAVVDSGIDLDHPDLAGNVKGNVNTISSRKNGNDDNDHGTHVAGTIAAIDNKIGVVGGAPLASLYAVKVLDRKGSGWLVDIIEGLQWCIDNDIDVINLSIGSSSGNQSYHDAIKAVYNAGIVIVAAAGNNGQYGGAIDYPGFYTETIAVSAIDANNDLAYFSSYGPQVDITAPGYAVYSTVRGGEYDTFGGTSMAAPHVVAAAALVLSTPVGSYDLDGDGAWDPIEVKNKLTSTASNIGLDPIYQGAGLVNAWAATQ